MYEYIGHRRQRHYRIVQVIVAQALRRGEIEQLQWGDVHLGDGEGAHIQLRAKATKAKRADTLPLQSDLADELRAARPMFAAPTALVFPHPPKMATLKNDLAKAEIPQTDAAGRVVDFHSLRYTLGTLLQAAGTPLRTAMLLMRHTDPKLTLSTYVTLEHLDTAGAIERLPDLDAKPEAQKEQAVMTGTDAGTLATGAEEDAGKVCTKKRAEGCVSVQNGAENRQFPRFADPPTPYKECAVTAECRETYDEPNDNGTCVELVGATGIEPATS